MAYTYRCETRPQAEAYLAYIKRFWEMNPSRKLIATAEIIPDGEGYLVVETIRR